MYNNSGKYPRQMASPYFPYYLNWKYVSKTYQVTMTN